MNNQVSQNWTKNFGQLDLSETHNWERQIQLREHMLQIIKVGCQAHNIAVQSRKAFIRKILINIIIIIKFMSTIMLKPHMNNEPKWCKERSRRIKKDDFQKMA